MNQLDEFSKIVARMGEERRAQDNQRLQAMQNDLEKTKADLLTLSNQDLLDYFEAIPFTDHDPRVAVLWQEIRAAAKIEIFRRMYA